jgi:Kef-type K+ transport system membrane component KefB
LHRLRHLSKEREWALDLRGALLVLFGLSWLATRIGTSILIAGFAVGLVVAATGGPRRLSRQVTGVAAGFFVPLFFVVLGARIDVRALSTSGALIGLALLLIAFDVAIRLVAAIATRQPVAAGLAATVTLGVPAAAVALGLQEGVVSPGAGAAIMVAALASIAVSGLGVSLLHRRLAGAAPEGTGAEGKRDDDRT